MPRILAPSVGQKHGGWTCLGPEPHVRKDGTDTEVYRWSRLCRHCGEAFETATTKNFAASKAFELVNCPKHRGAKP